MLTQGIHIHAKKKSIKTIDIIDECIFSLSITLHAVRNLICREVYDLQIDSNIIIETAYIFRANDFSAKFNFKLFPHIFVLYFNKRRHNNEN